MTTLTSEQISHLPSKPRGIGEWSILINNGYWKPRNFDILIIELLGYALQGKVSKILLGVPSRHGKSTLISKNFASYFLAHFPNDKVILTAYSQGLASEFGGQVKDVLNYYGGLSPYNVKLSTDSKAKNKFKLNHPYHGQMLAVGAGGSILGFGAGLFIVDDPIKNIADAESQVKQQRLADWFGGTAKTRLEKRTNGLPPIMLVIAQRLHLKDLHGIIRETEPTINAQQGFQILRNGGTIDPNTWLDLNIPAICDSQNDILGRQLGEALWPAQRSTDWLMAEKKAMGSYLFNAIYQGQPIERDGNIFKREWFMNETTQTIYNQISKEELPSDLPLMRYWDFAASGKDGDGTSGLLTGFDGENIYFIDLVSGNYSSREVLKHFKRTAKKDGRHVLIKIEQEPGAGSKLLIQRFKSDKDLKKHHIRSDKVKLAKNVRSFDLEALAEDGKCYFVKASWNIDLIDQLVAFTGKDGGTDDIVDTATGSARHWLRPKRKVRA
jgi:predicted phage terminase large subunit-like protein